MFVKAEPYAERHAFAQRHIKMLRAADVHTGPGLDSMGSSQGVRLTGKNLAKMQVSRFSGWFISMSRLSARHFRL